MMIWSRVSGLDSYLEVENLGGGVRVGGGVGGGGLRWW
jgi:hypothetical protein